MDHFAWFIVPHWVTEVHTPFISAAGFIHLCMKTFKEFINEDDLGYDDKIHIEDYLGNEQLPVLPAFGDHVSFTFEGTVVSESVIYQEVTVEYQVGSHTYSSRIPLQFIEGNVGNTALVKKGDHVVVSGTGVFHSLCHISGGRLVWVDTARADGRGFSTKVPYFSLHENI